MSVGTVKAIEILLGDGYLSPQDLQVIETLVFADKVSDHEEQNVIEKAILKHVSAETPLDRVKLSLMYNAGYSQTGWKFDSKTKIDVEQYEHSPVSFEDYQKNTVAAQQFLDTCVNNMDWNKLWFLNILNHKSDGSFIAWAVFYMCSCEKTGDVWQCFAGAEHVVVPGETSEKCTYPYHRTVNPSKGTCTAYDPFDGQDRCEEKLKRGF